MDDLRRRIGIVFQQPVTFPGPIARNVLFAVRKPGLVTRGGEAEALETSLRLEATTTIVLVTQQLAQARRVADQVACICPRDGAGELTEVDRGDAREI